MYNKIFGILQNRKIFSEIHKSIGYDSSLMAWLAYVFFGSL